MAIGGVGIVPSLVLQQVVQCIKKFLVHSNNSYSTGNLLALLLSFYNLHVHHDCNTALFKN